MTSQPLDLTLDELLTTTRSVRKRLDLEKPVPREVLLECLDLALQAPTGSNSQGWQWMFVEDPEKKQAIAEVYRTAANPYLAAPKPEYGDSRDERTPRASASPRTRHSRRRARRPGGPAGTGSSGPAPRAGGR